MAPPSVREARKAGLALGAASKVGAGGVGLAGQLGAVAALHLDIVAAMSQVNLQGRLHVRAQLTLLCSREPHGGSRARWLLELAFMAVRYWLVELHFAQQTPSHSE